MSDPSSVLIHELFADRSLISQAAEAAPTIAQPSLASRQSPVARASALFKRARRLSPSSKPRLVESASPASMPQALVCAAAPPRYVYILGSSLHILFCSPGL